METKSFNACVQETIQKYWDRDGLSDYGVQTFQYKDVARIIEKLHIILEASGVKHGDKVAICGRNSSRWGIAFFATLTYGAVAVPILHEFHPEQIHDIVNHSEAKLLFVGDQVWPKLNADKMPHLEGIFGNSSDEYTLLVGRTEKVRYARENLNRLFGAKYPMNFRARDIHYYEDKPDELAVLNYTSGTTSNSKGVMIPFRALWSNYSFAVDELGHKMGPGDKVLSMLPMAHMYGLVIEFIYPLCNGTSIYWMAKAPTPATLLKAFADVKPYLLVTVPLVMEKIYKSKLKPTMDKPLVKFLSRIPGLNNLIYKKVKDGLHEAFGGKVTEYIMGGAALNPEVERLFKKIKFPYTVGYGMTEGCPLMAYSPWRTYIPGSCGRPVDITEIRIDSDDPQHVVGEIQAKGDNITIGYYKNPEATANAFTDDGWLRTGDLGIMDAEGNIFIRGRSKNMILGPSGQNIYPEELEAVVNNQNYVMESVVVDRGGKLVALVFLDEQAIAKSLLDSEAKAEIPENIRLGANRQLPMYSQISKVELVDKPFEKTPKMSIRRFLYK